MRSVLLLSVAILAIACPAAHAEDDQPAVDIPVYPESSVTMEVNLTSEDILPMLQATLPLLSKSLGSGAESLTPEGLAELLSGVKRIEVLQVEVRRAKTTVDDVVAFYGSHLPQGQWRRVYYASDDKSSLAVYMDSGSQSYYGIRVRAKAEGSRTIKEALAAKIVGGLDFEGLLAFAAKTAANSVAKSR